MLRQRDEFVTEIVINARGLKYEHYVLDAEGKKIPRKKGDAAPVMTSKRKAKEEKKKGHKLSGKQMFKTETVTTSRGVKYQRYVKDANGQKIPLTEAEILALPLEPKSFSVSDKAVKKLRRKQREDLKKCPVPKIIGTDMVRCIQAARARKAEYAIRCGEFIAGSADYRIVLTNGDWVLIHMTSKKENKWMFYNPFEHVAAPFIEAEHKKGRGNENVIFPNGPWKDPTLAVVKA